MEDGHVEIAWQKRLPLGQAEPTISNGTRDGLDHGSPRAFDTWLFVPNRRPNSPSESELDTVFARVVKMIRAARQRAFVKRPCREVSRTPRPKDAFSKGLRRSGDCSRNDHRFFVSRGPRPRALIMNGELASRQAAKSRSPRRKLAHRLVAALTRGVRKHTFSRVKSHPFDITRSPGGHLGEDAPRPSGAEITSHRSNHDETCRAIDHDRAARGTSCSFHGKTD